MKKIHIIFFIATFFFVVAVLWWNNGKSAVNPHDKTQRIFIIKKGSGIREVANNLKKENLIADPVVFFLIVKKNGLDGKIQAGDFRLSPSQKAADIAESLTHGTLDLWITIPEGQRADQVADTLANKLPTYDSSWRQTLRNNEGYIFPDTYLIPKNADINLVISIMKGNFEKKFETINLQKTETKKDLVTIASLIEREAKHPQDRPLVASVIRNRLDIGMKLDIDATVQYAIGSIKCNAKQPGTCEWWPKHLTSDDLAINSLYNTYKNQGLPPTPIANPGLESLKAAANPSRTNYLYYISDKNGNNHYAETLQQHNLNIQKYGL